MFSLWSVSLSSCWIFSLEVMKGSAGLQVKKWWHCMDTPFQTDSHRNLWLWFPPQMAGMKRTVIHISRPKDPTKGLRNKKVPLRNLWTKQRSITHISYQMCYVALVKTKMWRKKRGTSIPLQTGCLSVVCMSHDPHLARASISNLHRTCQVQRSAEKPRQHHPSVGFFELNQGLTTTGSISCIKLIKVVGRHRHLCSHNARWKSSMAAAPLLLVRESAFALSRGQQKTK